MEDHPNFNFAKLVDGILRAKKITRTNLGQRTGFERKTFYRIIVRGEIPPKKTVITLGVALGLNLEQMHIFLYYAGYLFSSVIEVDQYYVELIHKFGGEGYDRIDRINEQLELRKVEEKHLLGKQ